jgi:hypothetical protein
MSPLKSHTKRLALAILFAVLAAAPTTATQSISITSAQYQLNGTNIEDTAGNNIINAGDLNQDGYSDLIIGAKNANSSSGQVYILYGNTITPNFTLSASDFTITSNIESTTYIGKVLAGNGDLDGDGAPDFALGVPDIKKNVYTYLSQNRGDWTSEMTLGNEGQPKNFNSDSSIMNTGENGFNFVSVDGDFNGDGYDDLLIGTSIGNDNNTGQTCLSLGRSNYNSLSTPINIESPSSSYPNINLTFTGEDNNDFSGYSASIIPDINSDGFDEILISAYNSNFNTGKKVYLFYGSKLSDISSINETTHSISLSSADAIFYSKDNSTDGFGETVVGLGDINGDLYGDFAIGAPKTNTDTNSSDAPEGTVYIYYGGPGKPYTTKIPSTSYSAKITAPSDSVSMGLFSIRPAGDINGDLLQDFIIGEAAYQHNTGRAFVFFGTNQKLSGTIPAQNADIIINGAAENSKTGYIVSSAGDINEDGIDEFCISSPHYNNLSGLISIFSLQQNTLTSAGQISSLKIYKDETYSPSAEITTANNFQTLYLELKTTTSPESNTKNIVELTASSNYAPNAIKIRLLETTLNSATFRGKAKIVRTRNSSKLNQISATINSTIRFQSLNNSSISNAITIENTKPIAIITATNQVSTGNATKIRINYTLYDYDNNNCLFDNTANQVQYSIDNGIVWHNATISGWTNNLTAKEIGKNHTASFQPLFWDAATDNITNNDCLLRIKAHDYSSLSNTYSQSSLFKVDNIAPEAPVLDQPPTKSAYAITITGQAEPNSIVHIYVSDQAGQNKQFSTTANTNINGLFEAAPVEVTPTRNRITAYCQDLGLNISNESLPIYTTFNQVTSELTNNGATINLTIPLEALNSDQINFQFLSSENISTQAPTYYETVIGFNLNTETESYITLNSSIDVTLNIPTNINTNYTKIYFWNNNLTTPNWSENTISVNAISNNQISFSTNYFSQFIIATLQDQYPPQISNLKINDEYVEDNSYQVNDPSITIDISDQGSGVSSWSITLINKETNEVITQNTASGLSYKTATEIGITQNITLEDSTYKVTVSVSDNSIHTTSKSILFKVSSNYFDFSILQAPNPYIPSQGNLTFGYNLSTEATELTIYLVNLRGDTIWTYQANNTELATGYNRIYWDGTDSTGYVKNGLYFAYCIAKKGKQVIQKKLKILVLK